MKFDHLYLYNGVVYPTGADVPVGVDTSKETEKKDDLFIDEPSDKEGKPTFSRAALGDMKLSELNEVAMAYGISTTFKAKKDAIAEICKVMGV